MDWAILPLRRYADFSGRSSRTEYWAFQILMLLVYGVLIVMMFAGSVGPNGPGALFVSSIGLMLLVALGTMIPSCAVCVRRLHDQDRSGWMCLLSLIPYVGGIILMVFLFLPGTPGSNRYGDDPRGEDFGSVFA